MNNQKWYLMRHGETDFNKKRYFYGSSDVSINSKGKEQAKNLAKLMAHQELDALYTSQLKRSQQTAHLAFPGQLTYKLSDFNERDFGQWEGLDANAIDAKFPREWQDWIESPFEVTPPQAEDFKSFQERVWKRTDQLLKSDKGRIAIVAHLGVLRLIYQYIMGQTTDFWSIDIPQGSVLVLECQDGEWTKYDLEMRTDDDCENSE
ncbi:histidine phosphatase family protein [Streptococcus catagoni]|uniref:histidine phosphatase family protein n=1 Tax=Streptococcus catagoni TaxID=2654874 RepID=UPI0014095F87|nr:histidine phosphatase family protein [Streptococcus catagoni]